MADFKSEFLTSLNARGFIAQCTDNAGLDAAASETVMTGYIGYDCTAPSLHVGNLISILMLRRLQQSGHRPIVVIGGGTTKIGDPSGKDESRRLLTDAQIAENKQTIRATFERFLTFGDGPQDAILVDNDNWLSKLDYIAFLRDYGRHFSINRMMSFDSVKLRLDREQPLSFLEFNYMILQAYDFLELNKKQNCLLQIGGSDQWGNIVNGVELIKRYSSNEVYGLTTELITLASGAKMGKTESGAIWLDKKLFSVFDYWQFWRNTDDKDVLKFIKMFTDLNLSEIEKISNLDINQQKIILANEATTILHGAKETAEAESIAKKSFLENSSGEHLPDTKIDTSNIDKDIVNLISIVEEKLSKSEIRRLIKSKGIKINNETISDDKFKISNKLMDSKNFIKLSIGKKKHYKIVF